MEKLNLEEVAIDINRRQLTSEELIITVPSVTRIFYQTTYKSPNNNSLSLGEKKFREFAIQSERFIDYLSGKRLTKIAGGLGEKSIIPTNLREQIKIIICILIDQQISDDFVLNENRSTRDYSGGGVNYSESLNKFNNPFDSAYEFLRMAIRSTGIMGYFRMLEIKANIAGLLYDPDAYLLKENYKTSTIPDDSDIGLSLAAENAAQTLDWLNFNKVNGLIDPEDITNIVNNLDTNVFFIKEVEGAKKISVNTGEGSAIFGDGLPTTEQNSKVNDDNDITHLSTALKTGDVIENNITNINNNLNNINILNLRVRNLESLLLTDDLKAILDAKTITQGNESVLSFNTPIDDEIIELINTDEFRIKIDKESDIDDDADITLTFLFNALFDKDGVITIKLNNGEAQGFTSPDDATFPIGNVFKIKGSQMKSGNTIQISCESVNKDITLSQYLTNLSIAFSGQTLSEVGGEKVSGIIDDRNDPNQPLETTLNNIETNVGINTENINEINKGLDFSTNISMTQNFNLPQNVLATGILYSFNLDFFSFGTNSKFGKDVSNNEVGVRTGTLEEKNKLTFFGTFKYFVNFVGNMPGTKLVIREFDTVEDARSNINGIDRLIRELDVRSIAGNYEEPLNAVFNNETIKDYWRIGIINNDISGLDFAAQSGTVINSNYEGDISRYEEVELVPFTSLTSGDVETIILPVSYINFQNIVVILRQANDGFDTARAEKTILVSQITATDWILNNEYSDDPPFSIKSRVRFINNTTMEVISNFIAIGQSNEIKVIGIKL